MQQRFLWYTIPPALLALVLLLIGVGSYVFSRGQHTFTGLGLKKMTMDDLADGVFRVEHKSLEWLAEGERKIP